MQSPRAHPQLRGHGFVSHARGGAPFRVGNLIVEDIDVNADEFLNSVQHVPRGRISRASSNPQCADRYRDCRSSRSVQPGNEFGSFM